MNIGGSWFPEPNLSDPEDPEWSWKEGIEMDRPAQSLYQLNEGKVFWDPYKHLRVNGMHPVYRWPAHLQCIEQSKPPNSIRHVKRTTEKFDRFDSKNYPSSKFTDRGKVDRVMYHPLYSGFKPTGYVKETPLDLSQIFYPPANEEWFKVVPRDNESTMNNPPKDRSRSKSRSRSRRNK